MAARFAFEQAERIVTELEQELRGLVSEGREAERDEQVARAGLGTDSTLADVVSAAEHVRAIRARVDELQRRAAEAYPEYTRARSILTDAERAAKQATWPGSFAAHLAKVDALQAAIDRAIECEEQVASSFADLGKVYGATSPTWVDGPEFRMASGAYGSRRLTRDSFREWLAVRVAGNVVDERVRLRAQRDALAKQAQDLEESAERAGQLQREADKVREANTWHTTRGFSPGGLVKVGMRGPQSDVVREGYKPKIGRGA